MGNSIFEALGGQQQPQRQDTQAMYVEFQKDPTAYLVKAGLKIPQEFHGDYRALVQHLAQTGQVPPILRGRVAAMLRGR